MPAAAVAPNANIALPNIPLPADSLINSTNETAQAILNAGSFSIASLC